MDTEVAKIDKFGRVLVPARFREQLGWTADTPVIVGITAEGQLQVWTRESAVRRAQELCRGLHKDSVVEAFLADRKREAQRENG